MLDWPALWRGCVIVFFALAAVVPFGDYRDRGWLVIISMGEAAPFLLLAIVLLGISMLAILYRRRCIAVTRIVSAIATVLVASFIVLLQPTSPIVRTDAYTAIRSAAFPTLLAIPMLLVSVPIAAVTIALESALARRWKRALRFVIVPAAGVLLFGLSSVVTDMLTVWSCAGPIQSALHTVKIGGHLPIESQQFPISVFHTKPDVAVEWLESLLSFPSLIAYDTQDREAPAVAARIHKAVAPACEEVNARRVWGDYYWVNIGC